MRNFRRLVLGLVLVTLAGVSWGECVEGDCVNGKGKYSFPSGDVYEGYFKDFQPSGKGRYVAADGYVYEGEFHYGKQHGLGKQMWPSGAVYQGELAYGSRTEGTFTYPDGTTYEGEFHETNRHGQGKYTWPNGDYYIGEHREGKFHGRGKRVRADGEIVREGIWQDDKYWGTREDWESSKIVAADPRATRGYVELECSGSEDNRRVVYYTMNADSGNPVTRRKVRGEIEKHSRVVRFREKAPSVVLMQGTKCSIKKNLKNGWDTPTDFKVSANMIEATFKQRLWCGGNNKVFINRLTGVFTSEVLGKDLPLTCKLKVEPKRRF